MYRKGGIRPFLIGSAATIYRDIIFGGAFAFVRHEIGRPRPGPHEESDKIVINISSACFATILSSPLNYARNIHYATPPGTPHKTIIEILIDLIKEAKSMSRIAGIRHVQSRLRIGWGTARVGCGIAFTAQLYNFLTGVL